MGPYATKETMKAMERLHELQRVKTKQRELGIVSSVIEEDTVDKYSAIPNPGSTPNERVLITAGGSTVGAATATLIWDWPAMFMADLWGPVVYTVMFIAGTFLMVNIKKSPFQLAVMEFAHLGLRPELIGEVIVENRGKAHAMRKRADEIRHDAIGDAVLSIGDETLDIINGFQDDPSDVGRSRTVLRQCLDQADKIITNYMAVENRRAKLDNYDEIADQTLDGLRQINGVLTEQHRRNMENNTTALEVDLEVSDQLLSKLSNS